MAIAHSHKGEKPETIITKKVKPPRQREVNFKWLPSEKNCKRFFFACLIIGILGFTVDTSMAIGAKMATDELRPSLVETIDTNRDGSRDLKWDNGWKQHMPPVQVMIEHCKKTNDRVKLTWYCIGAQTAGNYWAGVVDRSLDPPNG